MEVEVEATNGSSYPHGLLESADVEVRGIASIYCALVLSRDLLRPFP